MKINVTMLSSYLYCKRKLYLEAVKKIKEPLKESLVKGSIQHSIFDRVNKIDESIVNSIAHPLSFDDILMLYRRNYYKTVFEVLETNKMIMGKFDIKFSEFFHRIWPVFLAEAELRSNNVFEFIKKERVYGKELWENLWPKYLTELDVVSENLRLSGIVDRIELYKDQMIPIEIKSGKSPQTGVWPGHRIQIVAYMLLLKEKFNQDIGKGYIDYLDAKERRLVAMNPFIEEEVKETTKKVIELLEQNDMPDYCENKNKCKNCGLREECSKN